MKTSDEQKSTIMTRRAFLKGAAALLVLASGVGSLLEDVTVLAETAEAMPAAESAVAEAESVATDVEDAAAWDFDWSRCLMSCGGDIVWQAVAELPARCGFELPSCDDVEMPQLVAA